LLIKVRHLTIPNESGLGKGRKHSCYLTKATCVISTVPTEEVYLPICIEDENPPPTLTTLCQTNPLTAVGISPLGPTATTQIDANATPTFAIFV
jgi:hypothetical protein